MRLKPNFVKETHSSKSVDKAKYSDLIKIYNFSFDILFDNA
jgi:hypothetical protein